MKKYGLKTISLFMTLIMVFSIFAPAVASAEEYAVNHEDKYEDDNEKKYDTNGDGVINYVALGASNTNGYGLDGYLPEDVYEDPLSASKADMNVYGYLRAPEGAYPHKVANALAQVTGYDVDLHQLAISSMRVEEVLYLLDDTFTADAYMEWRFTGGQKWFDIAEEGGVPALRQAYMKYVSEADLITVDLGWNNFGVYAFNNIKTIMADGRYWKAPDWERFADYQETYETLKSMAYSALMQNFGSVDPALVEKLEMVAEVLAYAIFGSCYHFDKVIDKIYELNQDANVIVINVQNLADDLVLNFEGNELPIGDLYGKMIEFVDMYRALVSPHKDSYIFTIAGKDGDVTTFLDEICAWDGDPDTLTGDTKDCFDMYDDSLYVRSIVEYVMVGQTLSGLFAAFRDMAGQYGLQLFENDQRYTYEFALNMTIEELLQTDLASLDFANPSTDLEKYAAAVSKHLKNLRGDKVNVEAYDYVFEGLLNVLEAQRTQLEQAIAAYPDVAEYKEQLAQVEAGIEQILPAAKEEFALKLEGVYHTYHNTLNYAYDVVATILQYAARINVIELNANSLNGFGSATDKLIGYIAQSFLGGAEHKFYFELQKNGIQQTNVTEEPKFAVDESLFDDPAIKAVAVLAVRYEFGNSFFAHPNETGHDEIKDAILNALVDGVNVKDQVYETIKEYIDQFITESMITNYYKNEDSRYLAIGNMGSVDMGEHYSALLADKLDIEYEFLDKADLRISDLLALFDEEYINDEYGNALMSKYDIEVLRDKYADAIKASDLITLDFGVDDFRGFITDQMMGYIVETYNDKFTTIKALSDKLNIGFPDMTGYKTYEMDFTRFEEIISEENIEKILDKVREIIIEQGIPEEEELVIPLSDILGVESPMLKKLEIVFDLYPVDMTVYLAECYLYAAINYAYNYISVIEQIRAINPDAEIVVLGGINAFNKLQLSMGEDVVDLSMIGNAAVLALDGYKLAYAFAEKGVSYVYIKGTESELLAQKDMPELTDLLVFDMTVGKLSFAPAAFNASVEGNKYIYEQLCNTIVISCHHEYDSDCDDTCNKCEEKRYVEDHIYDTVCDAYCNVCGAEREAEDHKYDNACDKTCNVCGAEREVEDHKYDNACDKTCNECGAERTPSAHEYDNECDEICNECEEKRIVIHVYESDCDVDCDRCGADRYPREHIFGDWVVVKEATVDEDGMRERTCSVCNHKESRVISKQTAVTSNDKSDGSDDGIPTVVIVLIAVSVAVAAGGAVVFIVKKKILL